MRGILLPGANNAVVAAMNTGARTEGRRTNVVSYQLFFFFDSILLLAA